jgi:putative membrane protein
MTAPLALLALVGAGLVWSGVGPYDRTTWWLEVLPVLVACRYWHSPHGAFR